MSSAHEKLRRILELERDQGYRDRAVIGGLARFLAYWEKEAREEAESSPPSVSVDQVTETLAGYAAFAAERRCQAIETLLSLLTSVEAGPPASEKSSTPTPAPSDVPPPETESSDEDLATELPTPVARPPHPKPADASDETSLNAPVTTLKGVSTVNQKRLARLGVQTVRDLLYHFPRRYDDFAKLKPINRLTYGDEVTIVGVIQNVRSRRSKKGQVVVRVVLSDGTGSIEASWFNQPYLEKSFRIGTEIVLSGKIDEYLGRLVLNAPEWEFLHRELLHTGRLVPVYPLTEGIGGRWLRRLVKSTLDHYVPRIVDPLPPSVRESAGLMDLNSAMRQIHFPDSVEILERARHRLCFDELFLLQLGVLRHRHTWRAQRGRALEIPQEKIDGFIRGLPFKLTEAQQRAIQGILEDLKQPVPMSRLLQGDVGSGKTVVAAAAMLATVHNGLQTAIMAPTSILAEQHYRTLSELLGQYDGIQSALLVGSLPASEKRRVQEGIAEGRIQVIVGTHALIQGSVDFARLGFIVVDEQHRFGVAQRGSLRAKGGDVQPHLLAMSATPIPRTLALTLYGDLDISVLDEMPPHRKHVITAVRDKSSRERIYSFINAQVAQGRQVFVICPLVQESDKTDAKAAVAEHERLQKRIFPNLKLGLLHGRMSAEDKERVMADFIAGQYDILVSTAVVEVGIDIPNASVILIEGADRFGLAQLHQFRGRVGRGEHKSYCILMSDDPSEQGLERLRIMEEVSDGFVLAEKDLELRGPGDFLGVRQHGLPELRVAKLSDTAILERARKEALAFFAEDPDFAKPEHQALASSVRRFWSNAELS